MLQCLRSVFKSIGNHKVLFLHNQSLLVQEGYAEEMKVMKMGIIIVTKIILLIVMDCDGSFVPEIEMSKVKLTESVGASTYKATLARPPS